MNINNFELLYRRRKTWKGVTGSVVNIDLDPVDTGWIRLLSHVTLENKTSECTKVRLVIFDGTTEYPIDEAMYPGAEELLIHNQDIILQERDGLRAKFTGTVTGDNLQIVAVGWDQRREK